MIRIFRVVIVPHRHCVVLRQQIYGFCKANMEVVQIGEWRKIMKMDPKQVHMAPFGLIFIQNASHKLWEASGMPPGPQNAPGKSKNPGFPGFFNIFLSSLNSNRPALAPCWGGRKENIGKYQNIF